MFFVKKQFSLEAGTTFDIFSLDGKISAGIIDDLIRWIIGVVNEIFADFMGTSS